MIDIRLVEEPEQKIEICTSILRALPSWFGIETSIADYAASTRSMPTWVAFDDEKPIGFVVLKKHNAYSVEISVMGVLNEYHRIGVGRELYERCEEYCVEQNVEFITVKTLDETIRSLPYAKTRRFYLAMGFRPLEVFPSHWNKDNPCLFMAKNLAQSKLLAGE